MLVQRRCHDSATQAQDKAFWYLTYLNTVSSIGQDHRQAESCGAMDKTDKFVTALVGSGVAEIAAEARKLWREVVQSPKTMFTCVAIAMATLVGAGILLTEYFCWCRVL